MRGISLDEIVATTKIGRRLLIAMEEEQFDLLPGGIFNKSYVRAYAKCVGMNEDEAVSEYLEAAQEPVTDTKVIAHQHAFHADRPAERSRFPITPVLILIVVAVGAAAGWRAYQAHRQQQGQTIQPTQSASNGDSAPSAGGTSATPPSTITPQVAQNSAPLPSAPAQASAAVGAATSSQPGEASSVATGSAFEVTIQAKDRAWVSVKADGKFVVRGIIKPPDVKTVRANSEVIFYTGNAGHVEVAFNGKNVQLSAGANEPQTVVFDSRGVLARADAQ